MIRTRLPFVMSHVLTPLYLDAVWSLGLVSVQLVVLVHLISSSKQDLLNQSDQQIVHRFIASYCSGFLLVWQPTPTSVMQPILALSTILLCSQFVCFYAITSEMRLCILLDLAAQVLGAGTFCAVHNRFQFSSIISQIEQHAYLLSDIEETRRREKVSFAIERLSDPSRSSRAEIAATEKFASQEGDPDGLHMIRLTQTESISSDEADEACSLLSSDDYQVSFSAAEVSAAGRHAASHEELIEGRAPLFMAPEPPELLSVHVWENAIKRLMRQTARRLWRTIRLLLIGLKDPCSPLSQLKEDSIRHIIRMYIGQLPRTITEWNVVPWHYFVAHDRALHERLDIFESPIGQD